MEANIRTMCLGPCRVEYYGNPLLKVRIFGFIGKLWLDIPFMCREDALAFAKDHGWKIMHV